MIEPQDLSLLIKKRAAELGFAACGIVEAAPVDADVRAGFERWLAGGNNGTMAYMTGHFEKRINPTLLVDGCRSIIVVAQNYFPATATPSISRYAQGTDYHYVVKEKLARLLDYIREFCPVEGRAFCDSAPVLERYWAVKAGLGWCGKNHQLIIPGAGTHFFLGELLVDVNLCYDAPYEGNRCGNCSACIDACPGKAFDADGFDARRCLSYFTIEYGGDLPEKFDEMAEKCFYGCDRCQTACPHNRFATSHDEPLFSPSDELLAMTPDDWRSLTKEQFNKLFKHSAAKRCGYDRLMRNIRATLGPENNK